jgi:hypothetical protein
MKYLVFVLFFVVSVGFGQVPEFTSGYEIFARVTECRESTKDDFIPGEFKEAIGMFSFEEDTIASLISIRGNFTGWEKEYWMTAGKTETNQIGHFIQIIFPIMNAKTKEIGMFSFIKGPFDFVEHYHQSFGMPPDGLKFEATILLTTKRHTYIGIY